MDESSDLPTEPTPIIFPLLLSPKTTFPPLAGLICKNLDASPVMCLEHPLSRYQSTLDAFKHTYKDDLRCADNSLCPTGEAPPPLQPHPDPPPPGWQPHLALQRGLEGNSRNHARRLHQLGEIGHDSHDGLRFHHPRAELAYAFLVMDLIVSADIHIVGQSTKMTKLWVIAENTFKKKSGNRDGAGPSRARAHAPAPARASLQSIDNTLNRLTLTVDDMGQYIERMNWMLQRQHHDMRAFFRGINYVPPPFDSTILGQTFEGDDEDDDSYAPSSSPDEADFDEDVDGDPMDVEDDKDDDDDDDEDAES
ncbi:unnamed protein product [Cuscuta campestris]|uniref:Uncharacterized protein n=1 Tax=Cuscuta campestris TaxID=132261 RepID=A0A484LR75_9ASTE|nr:unnamed protein product [Cuscuta campestris]